MDFFGFDITTDITMVIITVITMDLTMDMMDSMDDIGKKQRELYTFLQSFKYV